MIAIGKKYYDFLAGECEAWKSEALITDAQAANILSLYEVREHSLRKILLIAGIILLGLGGVSFLAAKWHTLPKLLRVCVIITGYTASLCGYIFTGSRSSGDTFPGSPSSGDTFPGSPSSGDTFPVRRNRAGRLCLLLGSIIFGAGIYLITRMYNYKLEYSEVLLYWLMQLLITTQITRDEYEMYFTLGISLLYLLMTNAIDIFALEFMGLSRAPISEFFRPLTGFVIISVLWLVCYSLRDRLSINATMMLTLLVLTSRLSICLGGTWTLIILALSGGIISISGYSDAEVIGLLVLGLSGIMLTWSSMWSGKIFSAHCEILSIMSAIMTSGVMLLNIKRGHSASGITFCVLMLLRYFFDQIFGYIPKAWGFTFLGIVLLLAGIYYGRPKPQAEE